MVKLRRPQSWWMRSHKTIFRSLFKVFCAQTCLWNSSDKIWQIEMRKSHSRVTVNDKISTQATRKPQIFDNSRFSASQVIKKSFSIQLDMFFCWQFFEWNFTTSHSMTWIAAVVASLQMYTDKVFQNSVLTCMKVIAGVFSLRVDSPVLESRLFQVCSTQWLISDLPSWWLGINSLRIIRSRFRDAKCNTNTDSCYFTH